MSERSERREQILAVVKAATDRPRFNMKGNLTDEIMVLLRQAQADAWVRGWAAGKLDVGAARSERRTNPYMGGRHAGPPQPSWDLRDRKVTAVNYWDGDQWIPVPPTAVTMNDAPGYWP